jgi:hypothetical protein
MFRRTFVVALLALGLMLGTAQAGIISSIVVDPTAANMPFLLENFGSGVVNGLVSSASLTTSTGVDVSFTGSSGVYGGDVSGVTRSPFRTSGGSADDLYYLNAQAGAGNSVVLAYTQLQTAFNLLWGSVDTSPVDYNQLTFTFSGGGGSQIVYGSQVVVGLSGVVPGTTNLAVSISGLNAFNTITVTASKEAFEFVPGVPVPDGGTTVMLLGGALVGLGALRRKFRG